MSFAGQWSTTAINRLDIVQEQDLEGGQRSDSLMKHKWI